MVAGINISKGLTMELIITRLKLRSRYYWRKVCHFFGRCPYCGEKVNYTMAGRAICPNCGK